MELTRVNESFFYIKNKTKLQSTLKNTADFLYLCSTTITEASEVQARLLELSTGILQSNHAHSVLLRELINRQDEMRAQVLGEIRSLTSSLGAGGTASSGAPTHPTLAGYQNNSDNSSIMSKQSIHSLRLGRPTYLEDLKASRAYKRLKHFGLGIDSSADSALTFDSGCSVGNWSMLSKISLGDLSVSEIAVLNLPINLADVSNPVPFQDRFSRVTPRSRRRLWSPRGRIHNAIENGSELVVRAVLTMGTDIEDLDSNGRTPLVHATMKRQEAICKLLVQKGASKEALKEFTSGMDIHERSELLDQALKDAMNQGSETTLRLLVLMALGTSDGIDGNRSSSQIDIAIDMSYDLAVRAIIHLEPRVLVEVDAEGRTPFAYAYHLRRNEICEMLLQSSKVDTEIATEAVRLEGDFAGRVHAVIVEKCPQLLRLQLISIFSTSMDVEKTGIEGQTLLAHVAEVVLNSNDINCESWNYIFKALLDKTSRANMEIMEKIKPKPGARGCIAASMHKLVQELVEKDYTVILVLLSLMESCDTEGWTPLASAAFKNNEALCELLVAKGCTLCLNTEQTKLQLSCRIHDAARGGHKTALQLLLDMGADINERNAAGEIALLGAVSNNHLSCIKILIERGADATILTNMGASVLHRAAWRSTDSEVMKSLLSVVETRKLVNMKNESGLTALHYCSEGGNPSTVVRLENAKMLIQAGASLTIKLKYTEETPYERARRQERKELAKYLWSLLSPEQQAHETPLPPYW